MPTMALLAADPYGSARPAFAIDANSRNVQEKTMKQIHPAVAARAATATLFSGVRSRAGITRLTTAAAIAGSCAFAPAAFATTYSNTGGALSASCCLENQAPIGEVFNLSSAQSLTTWSFYALSGGGGTVDLTIAAWNGSHVVGPALYTTSTDYIGGYGPSSGNATLTFGGIDLALSAGSYIAFLGAGASASAADNVDLEDSSTDGGLGGDLRFLNPYLLGDGDPLSYTGAWAKWMPDRSLAYTATFSPTVAPTAVPEPDSIALLLAGLGLIGGVARRRPA
jgi:hypothetical protein